jgi:hypothetical protein
MFSVCFIVKFIIFMFMRAWSLEVYQFLCIIINWSIVNIYLFWFLNMCLQELVKGWIKSFLGGNGIWSTTKMVKKIIFGLVADILIPVWYCFYLQLDAIELLHVRVWLQSCNIFFLIDSLIMCILETIIKLTFVSQICVNISSIIKKLIHKCVMYAKIKKEQGIQRLYP